MVKNPPANAGDMGSSPDLGKSHTPQLLKPVRLEPMLHNKRGHCNEKPAYCKEEWPPLTATRETHSQHQRPNAAKNK